MSSYETYMLSFTRRFTLSKVRAAMACGGVLSALLLAGLAHAGTLQGVRMHEAPDSTRIVFDIDEATRYEIFSLDAPHRVVVDLLGVRPASTRRCWG